MATPSSQPARPAAFLFAFAPNPVAARAVSRELRRFLAGQGVPENELYAYELCIAEAANNAITYAEGPARQWQPVAEAMVTPDQIELRMTDHTEGFELPGRIAPPSPMRESGRGLFIIQSMMDEVRYVRGPKENILIMRKRRHPTMSPAAERAFGPANRLPGWAGRPAQPDSTRTADLRTFSDYPDARGDEDAGLTSDAGLLSATA